MENTKRLRVRRIAGVLLANAGLSAGFFPIGAFSGGGYACVPLLIVQPWILFRMWRNLDINKGWAVFLSILLTVTGWAATFLVVVMALHIQC